MRIENTDRQTGSASRRSKRYAQLLSLAQARFASQGFEGTSLSQVAKDAGIRKASLYYHFKTKEVLYLAVLGEIVAHLGGLVRDAAAAEGGFVERLDQLGGLVVEYCGKHPEVAPLLLREMVGPGRFVASDGWQAVELTLDLTARFLEAGMAAGAFRRQDPPQLTLSVVGLHPLYF